MVADLNAALTNELHVPAVPTTTDWIWLRQKAVICLGSERVPLARQHAPRIAGARRAAH